MSRGIHFLAALLAGLCIFAGTVRADETALFTTSTAPDALIVLDLSGSMSWNPAGDDLTYGSTDSCVPDTTNCSGTGCAGGYCSSSKSGTTYYAASNCATADTANCTGTNCANGFCSSSKSSSTYYAASNCATPDTSNCRGASCGRTDGFCSSSVGAATYYAHSSCSVPDTDQCRQSESWPDCANGFCASSHSYSGGCWGWWCWGGRTCTVPCSTAGCSTTCTTGSCNVSCTSGGCTKSCSRLAIAKRSIFNILDDNNDGSVGNADETSLGVRMGYMRFYNCNSDDTGNDYSSGCNSLVKTIGSSYSSINTAVSGESASGGTPIATALREAKAYLDVHKAADSSKNCRSKFVILVTDGADTFACGADGSECDSHRYANRREVVAKAKALGDAGYKVFVIGFGAAMPPYLRNTLNWMAYYGGTDDPYTSNSGSTTGYNIVTGCDATTNPTACCNTTTSACYPAGVSGCSADTATTTAACYDSSKPYPGTTGNSTNSFQANANDPGYTNLSGYAFIAADADQLVASVKAAMNIVREATYSFSQASIQSSRTQDENYIYEGSFQPISGDSFWLGHLKKYAINSDGTVGSELWDAGTVLKNTAAADRVIKTYKAGSLIDFTVANLTNTDLGVTSDTARTEVVGYFRGETAYQPENWKLGDVFRSPPITVGTPSAYFDDFRDSGATPNGFAQHRTNHVRASSPYSGRVILAGANDGQLHAFRTSDGTEAWSFIPPNQLSRLKLIAHKTEPTSLTHQYFVDGPVTVADAWVPASAGTGTSKSASDWKTILMFGQGRGAGTNLWSSSSSCDSGFNQSYTTSYPYYCGYYGMDVTSSLTPTFKWRMGMPAAAAPYMGAPWSKALVSRVIISGNEKWVAFIGGGAAAPGASNSGKSFHVIDLVDGSVLWSYTKATNSNLDNPMPAAPAIVDTDNDGFIDTAYIGDLGSNMWRFKFCRAADGSSCSTSNWTGTRLFEATSNSGNRPIYTSAAVAKDGSGNLWVYWGTGDKTDPTSSSAQEKFFGLKDTDLTSTRTISDVENITSSGSSYSDTSKYGYYMNLAGQGEKMLADPTVFGGLVYFTTFIPSQGNSDPCAAGGTASLYGLNYTTGGGALPLTGTPRSMVVGTGISSAPVISLKPSGGLVPDLYVTTSGSGTTGAQTMRVNINPPGMSNRTNMLYWKDKRVE
jgi:hypothetical protein